MIESIDVSPSVSLLEVGGGASRVVDALLERGRTDLTVLDISTEGLRVA